MSEYIRLQANGADAYPDASTENTYRPNGTSVENALVALESNVTTLGGVAGDAKTLAEQNSVKIATAEQEISALNSSLVLDYSQSRLPETTDINSFLQMVLERMYPNKVDFINTTTLDWNITYTNGSTTNPAAFSISTNGLVLKRSEVSGSDSTHHVTANVVYSKPISITEGMRLISAGNAVCPANNNYKTVVGLLCSSDNGITWNTLKSFSGKGTTIGLESSIDLSTYAGHDIIFKITVDPGWQNIAYDVAFTELYIE